MAWDTVQVSVRWAMALIVITIITNRHFVHNGLDRELEILFMYLIAINIMGTCNKKTELNYLELGTLTTTKTLTRSFLSCEYR